MMMSSKLAHLLSEEKIPHYKWASLVDIDGSKQEDAASENPTFLFNSGFLLVYWC